MFDNIQLPAVEQIALATFICGAFFAFYYKDTIYKKALKKIAPVTNAAMDVYLNHKYKDAEKALADKPQANVKVYQLLNIDLYYMHGRQMIAITKKPNLETCLENVSLDLNMQSNKIICNKILAHLWDVGYEIKNNNIYGNLKYQYGDKIYTYYFKCNQDRELSLPIYSVDDLDSCFETQYTEAHISIGYKDEKSGQFLKINDTTFDIIKMAAGPKGNFYSDKEDQIIPNQILELSDMGDTDWLILTTVMGDDLLFTKHDKMICKST